MENTWEYRALISREIPKAQELILEVFMEDVSPFCYGNGLSSFKSSLFSRLFIQRMTFYGAFDHNKMIGVISIINDHISYLFVKKEYQKRGVGSGLYEFMKENSRFDSFTVNSAVNAIDFYRTLGFEQKSDILRIDGIVFCEMETQKKQER